MVLRSSARATKLHLGVSATLALAGIAGATLALSGTTTEREGTFGATTQAYAPCEQVIPATDGLPPSCAHADAAPPGVDVTKPVATATLEARRGGAAAAVAAAQEEGVPVAASVAAVTNLVPCDGDGTSGYRTQAIYAVAAGKTNRYSAVSDQIKQWASGVNTVFNLSAAKTGGVRDVRFVTADNGDGTCSPTVLNVTLPAGAFGSFGATVNALRAAGYTSSTRKYLVWADATGLCGIAQTYFDSKRTQNNYSNGYAGQVARIDTGCWGQAASVEAHELSHTLGSVQGDAPHATRYGHCTDESDRMCYTDGAGSVMKKVCNSDQEILFDCRDDDYYSTYPAAGSYLATHWNTADSRFLIGGGDGTNNGSVGTITHLGGALAFNTPAVPGLPTQVTVNLEIPSGRTTTVAWTSTRADCAFADRTAAQTLFSCAAGNASGAPITATVTDSAGEKIVRTGKVTYSATARTSKTTLLADGAETATYTACAGGHGLLSARVLDAASDAPVKGVTVRFLRTVGAAAPVTLGTAVTNLSGTAVLATPMTAAAGVLTAKTVPVPTFPSTVSSTTTVTVAPGTCATGLTAGADDSTVNAGAPVTLSGTLTRTPSGGTSTVAAGETVTIVAKAGSATTWVAVGSARTNGQGGFTFVHKPVVSTTYQARFATLKGMAAATATSVVVTVTPWTTALTAAPTLASPVKNTAVTVTGTLEKSDGSATSAMGSAPIQLVVPILGGRTATVAATTKADGTYTVTVKPTASGTITVKYVGRTGWGASSATVAVG